MASEDDSLLHCVMSFILKWNTHVVSLESSCWCKKEMSPYWGIMLKYISLIMKKVSSCCLAILPTSVLTLAGCSTITGHLSVCLPDLSESSYRAGIVSSKQEVLSERLLSNVSSKGVGSLPQTSLGNCWWEDSIHLQCIYTFDISSLVYRSCFTVLFSR